jgi:hypothetical protein
MTAAEWLGIACIGVGLAIVTASAIRARRDEVAAMEGG